MPKMKTKSSAKKRFKVTATGKVKSKAAFTSHMMMNKSKKMKSQAKGTHVMSEPDGKSVLAHYMPYSRKKKKKAPAARKGAE